MSEFVDFLKKKKDENLQEEVNWMQIKNEWQQQLKLFMNQIEGWLHSVQKDKLIEIKEKTVTLQEENLGLYDAPSLELAIDKEIIKVQPIGRLIIGAKGRVDIVSSYEKYIVLYLIDREWVYRKETDKGKFSDFTKEKFEIILEDLL